MSTIAQMDQEIFDKLYQLTQSNGHQDDFLKYLYTQLDTYIGILYRLTKLIENTVTNNLEHGTNNSVAIIAVEHDQTVAATRILFDVARNYIKTNYDQRDQSK